MRYFNDEDSYIFTSENNNKPLKWEAFTNLINKFIKKCADKLDGKSNLTSHSSRIGFIYQLWRDTNDIEFVKQSIGHRRMDTTSSYVEMLSDQERQERTLQLN